MLVWRGASLSVLGRMGLRLTEDATHTLLSILHTSPKDAVSLAQDVRAGHTLGMHFGTFYGSEDESVQPLVELAEALMDGSEEVVCNMNVKLLPKGRGAGKSTKRVLEERCRVRNHRHWPNGRSAIHRRLV
ncbi:hypothetical protein D9758_015967 [Tetrapyrgos nigripes]|uniref:Uncharacterized protein n=1 Tax=Tetrapyrgos nigripes TaxID=182062 RepID=A0A8H5C2U9_9AGAR|nr:hypothetical protein D9758_015967 [Tetrapyrgos nigripes]